MGERARPERARRASVLALVGALALACGATPPPLAAGASSKQSSLTPGERAPACASEPWGGWDGTPACRALSQRRVLGAHRRCTTSAECVLFANCNAQHAVASAHADRYRRRRPPCSPPGVGNCGMTWRAVCEAGCCVAWSDGL